MTTTFDKREQGYESKYAHDQEIEFKISARTMHLLGLWAAKQIQLSEEAAERYAQSLVEEVVKKDYQTHIKNRIQKDFSEAELEISPGEIEVEMEKFLQLVRNELVNVG